jgi:hypothetical protein
MGIGLLPIRFTSKEKNRCPLDKCLGTEGDQNAVVKGTAVSWN